jgi:hypothetical protein
MRPSLYRSFSMHMIKRETNMRVVQEVMVVNWVKCGHILR